MLEKRQRKFDSELQAAQEELKRERSAKDRLSRERDQAHAEKYAIEQSLSVSTTSKSYQYYKSYKRTTIHPYAQWLFVTLSRKNV